MFCNNDYKYHYFYKITNTINNKIYYGIHSTNDLDDGYMGSGRALIRAFKKYGKENFIKEIIRLFDSREELADYEKEQVNAEFIKEDNNYNISIGGEQLCCKGTIPVYDEKHNIYKRVPVEEQHNYKSINKGLIVVYDILDKSWVKIPIDEYNNNKSKYNINNPFKKHHIFVYLKNDPYKKLIHIDKNEFNIDKHVISDHHFQKNQVRVKDKYGNISIVSTDDPRYISGELIHFTKGYKFTEEQKNHLKESHKKNGHQKGEKNSQFGKRWIHKEDVVIKINGSDLQKYLDDGWKLGMKNKTKN